MSKAGVPIIASGNIGSDLIKMMRLSNVLEIGTFVGMDRESDGLKSAARMDVAVTHPDPGSRAASPW